MPILFPRPAPPSTSPTDEQAMWSVHSANDHCAFSLLVERWQNPIRRLCLRMTSDTHRAEDLTQDTFSKLFTHRAAYKPTGRFSTFLWRIATNLCYDELRRRQRQPLVALDSDPENASGAACTLADPAANPSEQTTQNEQAQLVRNALMQLPESYRAVLILRHYENLKFNEIAEALDIPEGTVKSRMVEALTRMHRLLQARTKTPLPTTTLFQSKLMAARVV